MVERKGVLSSAFLFFTYLSYNRMAHLDISMELFGVKSRTKRARFKYSYLNSDTNHKGLEDVTMSGLE